MLNNPTIIHGNKGDRPLFMFKNGTMLTRKLLVSFIRSHVAVLGINPDEYTSHSLRIGGATSAAAAGMADHEIKLLGRWSSDTYQRYIRCSTNMLIKYQKRMVIQPFHTIYNFRNPYSKNLFGN